MNPSSSQGTQPLLLFPSQTSIDDWVTHLAAAKAKGQAELAALEGAVAMHAAMRLAVPVHYEGTESGDLKDQTSGEQMPKECAEVSKIEVVFILSPSTDHNDSVLLVADEDTNRPAVQDGPLAQYPTYSSIDEERKWQRIQEWAVSDSAAAAMGTNFINTYAPAAPSTDTLNADSEKGNAISFVQPWPQTSHMALVLSSASAAVRPDGHDKHSASATVSGTPVFTSNLFDCENKRAKEEALFVAEVRVYFQWLRYLYFSVSILICREESSP